MFTRDENFWGEGQKKLFSGLVYKQQQLKMAGPAALGRLLDCGDRIFHCIETRDSGGTVSRRVAFLEWSGANKVNMETHSKYN